MSEISLKSITGITSITTPAGVDNQLTVHNNNTTEVVKFDNAGNVHINNQLEVSGVSTFAGITTNTSTLFANQLSVAGVSSFSGNLHSSGKLTINPDDNTTTWKRENKNMHQIRDDVYVEGTVNVGDKAGFDATPLGITSFTWVSAGTSYYSLTTNAHAIPQGTNVLVKDSVSGFQEAYNTTSGAGTTITVERAVDPSSELSVANTTVVVYTPADPRGCLNVAKDYAKVRENGFNPILRGFVGSSTTHPVGINTEVFKIEIKRDGTVKDSVATLLHSTRQMGSKQRLALTIDDGKSYPQGKNLVLTQTGVKINADDSAFSDANALLEVDGNVAIGITTPGKLGIGTHNPLTLLHLKSDDPTLRIQRHNQSAYGEITVDTAGKITLKSDPGNAANGDGFSFTVNNSEKVGISSDGTVTATAFVPTQGQLSNRNIVINGAMNVAQRGTSSAGGEGYKTVDRFQYYKSGTNETPNQAQVDVASGTPAYQAGFRKAYQIENGNQSSAGSSDLVFLETNLEAREIRNSGWNYTDSNSKITLSFWVKASVAMNYYGYLITSDGTAQRYTFETGALTANTWTKVTKTIPGNSNLQFDDDSNRGLGIVWWPYLGDTYTNASVPLNQWGAWATGTRTPDYDRSNSGTWYMTNDATFEITGVQLEVGPVATPFEHRSIGEELIRCQRYYEHSYNYGTVPGAQTNSGSVMFLTNRSPGTAHTMLRFQTRKRGNPTVIAYDPTQANTTGMRNLDDNVTYNYTMNRMGEMGCTAYPTGSLNLGRFIQFHYTADAEI